MKKLLLILIISIGCLYAQYYNERSAEQNYENSALFFKSHYLNTFSLADFTKVSAGLFDDPFMNISINPAKLPVLKKDILFYLDFRGDRNKSDLLDSPVYPHYFVDSYYLPPVDSRWNSVAREEPEPFVSLGFFTKLNSSGINEMVLGGSYQFISKNEPYYTMPYWIYNYRVAEDSFGNAYSESSLPVVDRYKGKDEMSNRAHLFTLYMGYEINEKLTAGFFANGVVHSRDGSYLNDRTDEYGNQANTDYENTMLREKQQDYSHFDVQLGFEYKFNSTFEAGIKTGYLKGKADQEFQSRNYYYYQYNEPELSSDWSYNYSNSTTDQSWDQDGNMKYIGFDFTKKLDNRKIITGYYQYSSSTIDTKNLSSIVDTSYYSSSWTYDYGSYYYKGVSSMTDFRQGSGTRETENHRAQVSFVWRMNERVKLRAGLFLESDISDIISREPVDVYRMSSYENENYRNYSSYYKLIEDKDIVWEYSSKQFSMQIPVVLEYSPMDDIVFIIGINRVYSDWDITERNTGYYRKRIKNEIGIDIEEKNFAERYTQPAIVTTEDETDMILGLDINISEDLKSKLLIDPEFADGYKVRQWWLSLRADL